MVRIVEDHVNWGLIVILVALTLLLTMVSSAGYGATQEADSQSATRADPVAANQDRKDVRTPSEVWYVARELYQAGRFAEASKSFEHVLAAYPNDPALKMWAGMASYRNGEPSSAIRHWQAVWRDEASTSEVGVWPAIALAAVYLESGRLDQAALFIIPLERGDFGTDVTRHPVVSFYAALVYEQLAIAAPKYRDAVEESLGEEFSPALASSDVNSMVSPNSQSWLIFLTKRCLQRTIRGARSLDWAAPAVPESAAVEPSLAPTVEDLLEALGSADFASQARRKLRALDPGAPGRPLERKIEIFDHPGAVKRCRFIA